MLLSIYGAGAKLSARVTVC